MNVFYSKSHLSRILRKYQRLITRRVCKNVLFQNVRELVALAEKENKLISEIMIEQEMKMSGRSREVIMEQMDRNLTVMEEATERGLKGVQSVTGLTGGDAVLIQQYMRVVNHCQAIYY